MDTLALELRNRTGYPWAECLEALKIHGTLERAYLALVKK